MLRGLHRIQPPLLQKHPGPWQSHYHFPTSVSLDRQIVLIQALYPLSLSGQSTSPLLLCAVQQGISWVLYLVHELESVT